MSNHHTIEPENDGASNNGSSFVSRREVRASNATGALPTLGTLGIERGYHSSFDFEQMIQSLRELFEHDRQIASQPESTRCGICYLFFRVSELHYQEEGFYACENCEQAVGKQNLPMLRKQQKL